MKTFSTILAFLKLPFSKSGRAIIKKENYGKHFFRSGYIATGLILIGWYFDKKIQFSTMPVWQLGIMFFVLGLLGNLLRETIKQQLGGKEANGKPRVPFSYKDCFAGAFGAGIFAAVVGCVLHLAFHFLIN